MNPPRELLSALREEDNFCVVTHVNPEGDALGSTLALAMALAVLGKNSCTFCKDPVPKVQRFLPGWQEIMHSLPPDIERRVLVLVDCGHPGRAGLKEVRFRRSMVIDHHRADLPFGDTVWIEPDAPAAGYMVYQIIKSLGLPITPDMATCLYTAISTDTGTFRYENTTPEALEACAELIRAGASPARIAERVYESWSLNRLRLLGMALETMEVKDDITVMSISKEMFRVTDTGVEDTEHFTVYPRMLAEAKIAAVFIEMDGYVKASLRSKGDVDVREIAVTFGGGGHRNASGYRTAKSLEESKKDFLRAAEAARRPV